MSGSLIDYIRKIESLPDGFDSHKVDLYNRVFEIFSPKSPLLKEDIEGKRGIIYGKVDRLAKKYGFMGRQIPRTVSDEDLRDIQELNKIIDYIPVSKEGSIIMSPVVWGPAGAVAGCLGYAVTNALESSCEKKISRRDFLKGIGRFAGVAAGVSVGMDECFLAVDEFFHMKEAKRNAMHVEEKINELYPL